MNNHSYLLLVAMASFGLVGCEAPIEDVSPRAAGPGVADVDFGIYEYVCDDDSRSPVGGKPCGPVSAIDRVQDPSSTVDPALCASLEAEAQDLIARHSNCELDTQCSMYTAAEANVDDTCLPMFECYLGLRTGADLEEFSLRARRIDELYAEAGCTCPIAMCTDPDRTLSVCDVGMCTLDVATAPDQIKL